MEALAEKENELQKTNRTKGKSGTSENTECLATQLQSAQREKVVRNTFDLLNTLIVLNI